MMDNDLSAAERFLKICHPIDTIVIGFLRSARIGILLLGVFLTAVSCVSSRGKAGVITGIATVIDGDTIRVQGRTIRFHGMDAPERNQRCRRGKTRYRCGRTATKALARKINRGTVRCASQNHDRYNRIIAVCRAGGVNLNAWMVLRGHAVAYRRYSLDYIPAEHEARSEGRGIWAGEFIFPWNWRRGKRLD